MFSLRSLVVAGALAVVATASFAQVPDGKVQINYNRCDKAYDGWGLHLWKNPNIPLVGVEWQNAMPPTGKNDFGVYFQRDLSEFGSSGTVNYIVHKGDTKDQGGKDKKFDGKTTKEIWVNDGDPEIYTALADAKKAREAKPCK